MELVTGHTGSNHVDAGDIRSLLKTIIGNKNMVGSNASLDISPASQFTLPKMDILWMSEDVGHVRVAGTESVSISNTSLGMYRKDKVCIKYTNTSGVENVEVAVLSGTAASNLESATEPTITNTATLMYLPLYDVVVNYSTVQSITICIDMLEPVTGTIPISRGGTGATSKKELFDMIYPVGSIYITTSNLNPGNLFGGSWQEIQGRFLLGRTASHAAGTIGGEEAHKLTVAEMPSHNHSVKYNADSGVAASGDDPSNRGAFRRNYKSGTADYYTTEYSGSSGAHNNMPPYLSVYIWKRTA